MCWSDVFWLYILVGLLVSLYQQRRGILLEDHWSIFQSLFAITVCSLIWPILVITDDDGNTVKANKELW